jgi:hypothetical protein
LFVRYNQTPQIEPDENYEQNIFDKFLQPYKCKNSCNRKLRYLLGWIFTNDKRQRIFNRASNSIVVKLKQAKEDHHDISNDVTYIKD